MGMELESTLSWRPIHDEKCHVFIAYHVMQKKKKRGMEEEKIRQGNMHTIWSREFQGLLTLMSSYLYQFTCN